MDYSTINQNPRYRNMYNTARPRPVQYEFVKKEEERVPLYSDIDYFYQVCTFPNPESDKYHLRKYVIGQDNQFLKVEEYKLTKRQYRKFLKTKSSNCYKAYPMYNLDNVGAPHPGELLAMRSEIISSSHNYTGYAPF